MVVEGFKPENLAFTRYSLSTKAADSLASGAAVLTYGPEDAGVISYLASTGATAACTNPEGLEECIRKLLDDVDYQKHNYLKAVEICKKNHTIESSCAVFDGIVERVIRK